MKEKASGTPFGFFHCGGFDSIYSIRNGKVNSKLFTYRFTISSVELCLAISERSHGLSILRIEAKNFGDVELRFKTRNGTANINLIC